MCLVQPQMRVAQQKLDAGTTAPGLDAEHTVKVARRKKTNLLGNAAHSDNIVSAYSLGTCKKLCRSCMPVQTKHGALSDQSTEHVSGVQDLQAQENMLTFEASSGTWSTCGTARAFTDWLEILRSPAMVS